MALYNIFHAEYDIGRIEEADNYHGEFDDEGYGSLYIPHIESYLASLKQVRSVFSTADVGDVTNVTFTELMVPTTYKGKLRNKKKAYSAIVYLKWRTSKAADKLRAAIETGDKRRSRILIGPAGSNTGEYWVIRFNSVVSASLLEERHCYEDLVETAVDVAMRVLADD